MGLDSFWVNDEHKPAFIEGEFRVCGGMLSDHGNSSFRGKVYDELIKSITGQSLYQKYISGETIKLMADALEAHLQFELCAEEYDELKKMFRAHANAGHGLVGWW